jgi:hypothetical protein
LASSSEVNKPNPLEAPVTTANSFSMCLISL